MLSHSGISSLFQQNNCIIIPERGGPLLSIAFVCQLILLTTRHYIGVTLTFDNLNLSEETLRAIQDLGHTTPTEIQTKSIPTLINENCDFVGQAQTGTGKTAAFVIPLIERIDTSSSSIQAVILTPTRELANQASEEIAKMSKYKKIRSEIIIGQKSYTDQIRGIKRNAPHIIVGTPGRIIDLLEKRVLDFSETKILILDEADEMLNMGFLSDVQEILTQINTGRNIWMFSATLSPAIKRLVQSEFKDPVFVRTENKNMSNDLIHQKYYLVRRKFFIEALCRLIDIQENIYGLIFCKTRQDTKDLSQELTDRGYLIESIHGDMGQSQREAALSRFKEKKVHLLACTDVAARGIDIQNVGHVFNYGAPQDLESYVHRIGRTGRAGKEGVAITLVDPNFTGDIRRIEQFIKKKIDLCKLPDIDELKKSVVKKELLNMERIKGLVEEKGESFKVDDAFETYKESFENLSKEDVLKVFFSWHFNRKLKRYDDIGKIDEQARSFGSFSSRPPRGRGGGGGDRSYGNYRRSGGGGNGGGGYRRDRSSESSAPYRERKRSAPY